MPVTTRCHVKDDQLKVNVLGHLDDEIFPVAVESHIQWLTIDLSKLDGINSIGIRAWVLWISNLPKVQQIEIIDCPWFFVEQAMILTTGLPSAAQISSLRIPFSCESCEKVMHFHVDLRDRPQDADITIDSHIQCVFCGGNSELDILPEQLSQALSRF